MSTTHVTDLEALPPLTRREAVALGRVEYRRITDAVAQLAPEDWTRPTDCEGWVVRDLVGHVAGAMHTAASLRRQIAEQKQFQRRARTTGENEVDAMTAIQIEATADLDHAALLDQMRGDVDRAARGRLRLPGIVARSQTFEVVMNTLAEEWSLDYLLGQILTRDTWLHRVADLARATGTDPVLDSGHDGRIVADVAAEWARRHGRAVHLTLTGPAGGNFSSGHDGPSLTLDAVEFCRVLSRRSPATHDLLEQEVPF